jgi:limonene-1,2-epoxide hydrolase
VAPSSRAAANDAFIRSFIAAWERRDSQFIVDAFTDDGVYHSVPLSPIVGKEAIRAFVTGFEEVPPGRLQILHQAATDDVVLHERVDAITLNGMPVTLPICGVFDMAEDGRIRAWREYFDLGPARAAYEA